MEQRKLVQYAELLEPNFDRPAALHDDIMVWEQKFADWERMAEEQMDRELITAILARRFPEPLRQHVPLRAQ